MSRTRAVGHELIERREYPHHLLHRALSHLCHVAIASRAIEHRVRFVTCHFAFWFTTSRAL